MTAELDSRVNSVWQSNKIQTINMSAHPSDTSDGCLTTSGRRIIKLAHIAIDGLSSLNTKIYCGYKWLRQVESKVKMPFSAWCLELSCFIVCNIVYERQEHKFQWLS